MNSTDSFYTFLILFSFTCLYIIEFYGSFIVKIKKNWPSYRCTPYIMPFASFFGEDPTENFQYCVQNIQSSGMDDALGPINYTMNNISNLGGQITSGIGGIRSMVNNIRKSTSGIFGSIMSVFLNIVSEVIKIIINLNSAMNKTMGILGTSMNIVISTQKTMESAWNGSFGTTMKTFSKLVP